MPKRFSVREYLYIIDTDINRVKALNRRHLIRYAMNTTTASGDCINI